MEIFQSIAQELNVTLKQVHVVVTLLDEGNTIPFIARYRKDKTGNLDEVQIRDIRDRFEYITDLEQRRDTILNSIEEQGKLTDALKAKLLSATTKQALEDIYLPFKPKKRTRATIAREKGLEPLAELIKNQEEHTSWLTAYLKTKDGEIEEAEAVQRACDIVAEWISEDADLREQVRSMSQSEGQIVSSVHKDYVDQKTKFEQYYEYSEPVSTIPAHRYLAIRRGEEESILRIKFEAPVEKIIDVIKEKWIDRSKGCQDTLSIAIEDAYSRLLSPSIEVDIRLALKTKSDDNSMAVFSDNMRNLLLAPLGGTITVLGVDPAYQSGTKIVVIDATGKMLENEIIYPAKPQQKTNEAIAIVDKLFQKHHFNYICIGNGTASREVMQFFKDYLKLSQNKETQAIFVNESGASVYSASDLAREEFPELDVSYRGAISIARRFQDPLAELVKIDPKSIGVGQYQHDVNQRKLKKTLDETVESCVNYVGVNLNTASYSLLSYVSGLNMTLAKNIVKYRDENGEFQTRKELLKVARFGPKSFEQSAGFLKIKDGKSPLDNSAVHPENYPVVLKMSEDLGIDVGDLIGNEEKLNSIVLSSYVTEETGLITLKDIIAELKKPGRDPRSEFIGAKLDDDVQKIGDLKEGMQLEGTVTNITNFGAFVDLGVHQDGLVHISELADKFVENPSDVCSVGDVVKVKVLEVDTVRKRIALSMKSQPQIKKASPSMGKSTPTKPEKVLTGDMKTDLQSLMDKFGRI